MTNNLTKIVGIGLLSIIPLTSDYAEGSWASRAYEHNKRSMGGSLEITGVTASNDGYSVNSKVGAWVKIKGHKYGGKVPIGYSHENDKTKKN